MARYAAIDIGSNSVRMLAAEVAPSNGARRQPPPILAADREVTRLGESVFRNGRISAEAIERSCAVLERMAGIYRRLEVLGIRAVATSAVRDASNQEDFLHRASEAVGVRVEIISGQEEARLIHLGVQSRWPHPDQRVLLVDVGGGSAEIICSEHGARRDAFSKPLGALRLTEVFLQHDPPAKLELVRMEQYIDEKIAPAIDHIGRRPFDRVIATSATAAAIVCAVNRIPRARRDSADRLRANAAQIRRLYKDLGGKDLAARRKVAGFGPRRAEIIIAGAAVFSRILDGFQARSLYYSAAGVRDGVIADLAARGVGRELSLMEREQRRVVEQMARRYGVPVAHARQVAALAHAFFESLQPLHRLAPPYGKLLQASAYLHDIGHYVSDSRHHKHSAYLVEHSDMPGFTDSERLMIAMLCRFHRKAMPSARHDVFQSLPPEERRVVTLLVPLLRLADSLDRSHRQEVAGVDCQLRPADVLVRLQSEHATDLDEWAAAGVADVFRTVYGRPLVLSRGSRPLQD